MPGGAVDMEVDGDGTNSLNKPLLPSRAAIAPTNIQQLTSKLEKISLKKLASDAKRAKKPKYIDTSKLLHFTRSSN
jgi:hypothetical protein